MWNADKLGNEGLVLNTTIMYKQLVFTVKDNNK